MKTFDIKDVETVKAITGIELRGDDGQPYCCGERMLVKSGMIGPDYAKCRECGQAIGNLSSPHVNGGFIPDEDFLRREDTWAQLVGPAVRLPGNGFSVWTRRMGL